MDPQPAALQPREAAAGGRRLAIVIDDLGRSVAVIDALEKLEGSFTYAVLPFEGQTAAVVAELDRRGLEFLCHLPMEAQGGIDAGIGALRARMGLDELKAATRKALAAVPGAIGVNNHMGSALVGDTAAMRAILNVVGEKSLFFLDSRTATNTKGFEVARELGLRAAERHVFLDNEIDASAIRRQFELFKATAAQRGFAIAIGHPHETTIAVLSEEIPKAEAEGFEMVHVSSLLSP